MPIHLHVICLPRLQPEWMPTWNSEIYLTVSNLVLSATPLCLAAVNVSPFESYYSMFYVWFIFVNSFMVCSCRRSFISGCQLFCLLYSYLPTKSYVEASSDRQLPTLKDGITISNSFFTVNILIFTLFVYCIACSAIHLFNFYVFLLLSVYSTLSCEEREIWKSPRHLSFLSFLENVNISCD